MELVSKPLCKIMFAIGLMRLYAAKLKVCVQNMVVLSKSLIRIRNFLARESQTGDKPKLDEFFRNWSRWTHPIRPCYAQSISAGRFWDIKCV